MTLTDGITTVTLRADMAWPDRFAWSPVVQSVDNTFGGGLVVETWERQTGRPITLQTGGDALIDAASAAQLQTWAETPGQQLTLAGLRGGADRTVVLRHQDAPAVDLEPAPWPDADGNSAAYWQGTIRLMEVA